MEPLKEEPTVDEIEELKIVSKLKSRFEMIGKEADTEPLHFGNSAEQNHNALIKDVGYVRNESVSQKQDLHLLSVSLNSRSRNAHVVRSNEVDASSDTHLQSQVSELNYKIKELEGVLKDQDESTTNAINQLVAHNNEMAANLTELNEIISDLREDNFIIKKALVAKMENKI